jgi:hypothetical protein
VSVYVHGMRVFRHPLSWLSMLTVSALLLLLLLRSDHGPLNTWDRGPYVTLRGSTPGKPSLTPAWRIIERNFLVNGGNWPL